MALEQLHKRLQSILHEAIAIERQIRDAEIAAGFAKSRKPKIKIDRVNNTIESNGITVQLESSLRIEFFSTIVNAPNRKISESRIAKRVWGNELITSANLRRLVYRINDALILSNFPYLIVLTRGHLSIKLVVEIASQN